MTELDTIVAAATSRGRAALAIVRMDGPRSAAIFESLIAGGKTEIRLASKIRLQQDGTLLDEAVAIRYQAPHSFTGNDLVELMVHGSPMIVEKVIGACIALGARLAQPGEFTERAVLNGKLDLVQAEAVADLINARTDLQARLSLANLEGALSRNALAVRETLLDVISRLEAALDFSEEGYDFISRKEVQERLAGATGRVAAMADTWRRGRATMEGVSAAILGLPNAGKSTLLNRLVGSDRAIVTPIPGTTRDVLHETIEIGGIPVTLADTAGLRISNEVVESIGIERARAAARTAAIRLYLIDASRGMTSDDQRELESLGEVIIVYTKCDLASAPDGALAISAASGEGMKELLNNLDAIFTERYAAEEGALVNERQRMTIADCEDSLRAASASLEAGAEEQIILVDLYAAANSLGLLTGAITRDEILSSIFGKFCIGK